MARSITLEQCKAKAQAKGGDCISTEYVKSRDKLKWKCKDGTIWETSYDNIRNGSWCSHNSHKVFITIEMAKELAEMKNGLCIAYRAQFAGKQQGRVRGGNEFTTHLRYAFWPPSLARK